MTGWSKVDIYWDGPIAGWVSHDGETLYALWDNGSDLDREFGLWRVPEGFQLRANDGPMTQFGERVGTAHDCDISWDTQ